MGCRNDLAKVAETAGCEVILLSSFLLHPKSNPQHASKNKSAAIIAIAILAADFIKKNPIFSFVDLLLASLSFLQLRIGFLL